MQGISLFLTKESSYIVMLINIFVVLQIGRVKFGQLHQIVRCHQAKDGRSKGEIIPLVQPLIPHVDCCEVLYVVVWLYVVHGGCYHSVQVVVGEQVSKKH